MNQVAETVSLTTIQPDSPPAEGSAHASTPDPVEQPTAPVVPPAGAATSPDPAQEDPQIEVAKRLNGIAAKEAKTRRLEATIQEQLTAFQAEREAFKKEMEEFRREREEFDSDPAGYALRKGKDPVEVAKRIARPETEVEKELRLIKEQLAAKDAREKEEREAREKAEAAHRREASLRDFVRSITPAECPTLVVEFEAREVPALLETILHRRADPTDPQSPTVLQQFQRTYKRNPTDAELRESLEHEAVLRATQRVSRSAAYAPKPPESSPAAPTVESGPPSISNQHGSSTNSAPTRKLSLEERRRESKKKVIEELESE